MKRNDRIFKVKNVSQLFNSSTHDCCFCKVPKGHIISCSYLECDKMFHFGCANAFGLVIHSEGMSLIRHFMETKLKDGYTMYTLFVGTLVGYFAMNISWISTRSSKNPIIQRPLSFTNKS
jgi:hypothetical protein